VTREGKEGGKGWAQTKKPKKITKTLIQDEILSSRENLLERGGEGENKITKNRNIP